MFRIASRVGPIAVESHPRETKQVPELFKGPQAPSFTDTNTLPEQAIMLVQVL
jgi:hypothetical protein